MGAVVGVPGSATDQVLYERILKSVAFIDGSVGFWLRPDGSEKTFFITSRHGTNTDKFQQLFEDSVTEAVLTSIKLGAQAESFCEASDVRLYEAAFSVAPPTDLIQISSPPKDHIVKPGDEVYFVGKPLTSNKIIVHKGYVSSSPETIDGAYKRITIDGNVLPGHSGSPVIHRTADRSNLYVIGMIRSQVVGYQDRLKYLEEHSDPIVNEIAAVFRGNMSTGIGCAVLINELVLEILSEANQKKPEDEYERVMEEQIARKPKGVCASTSGELKYMEVRFGTNRGIRFNGKEGSHQVSNLVFQFSPNPHKSSDYNSSGQAVFYQCAADAFRSIISLKDVLPETFSFDYGGTTFTAAPR